jgi:hypothetical protein
LMSMITTRSCWQKTKTDKASISINHRCGKGAGIRDISVHVTNNVDLDTEFCTFCIWKTRFLMLWCTSFIWMLLVSNLPQQYVTRNLLCFVQGSLGHCEFFCGAEKLPPLFSNHHDWYWSHGSVIKTSCGTCYLSYLLSHSIASYIDDDQGATMAIISGSLYGINFNPAQYLMDHREGTNR